MINNLLLSIVPWCRRIEFLNHCSWCRCGDGQEGQFTAAQALALRGTLWRVGIGTYGTLCSQARRMTLRVHEYLNKLQERGVFAETPQSRETRHFNPFTPARRRRNLTVALLSVLFTVFLLLPQWPPTSHPPKHSTNYAAPPGQSSRGSFSLSNHTWEYAVLPGFFAQSLNSTDDSTFDFVPPLPEKCSCWCR